MQLQTRNGCREQRRPLRRPPAFAVALAALAGALLVVLLAADAAAQGECLLSTGHTGAPFECSGSDIPGVFICGQDIDNCEYGTSPKEECPTRDCGGFQTCTTPIVPAEPTFEIIEESDGTFTARMAFDVFVPYMREGNDEDGEQDNPNDVLRCTWQQASTFCTSNAKTGSCAYEASDRALCFLQRQGLTCDGAPYHFGTYSFRAERCEPGPCDFPFGGCGVLVDRNGIEFEVTAEMLGCPVPRKEECEECVANVGGGMSKVPAGGDAPCVIPEKNGPKATLRYTGRGAGYDGLPGTDVWKPALGRNWSHDYLHRRVWSGDLQELPTREEGGGRASAAGGSAEAQGPAVPHGQPGAHRGIASQAKRPGLGHRLQTAIESMWPDAIPGQRFWTSSDAARASCLRSGPLLRSLLHNGPRGFTHRPRWLGK